MEMNSSGEDLVVKTRKPYTITKQREKWTEEEHNKFIEALKLYGRAWQKIEEHIGTKTAMQIRSHAQKFFTKLDKEALMKGIPFGQAHDIEIPPPRPKRKPASPYPRKTGVVSFSSPVEGMDDKTSKSSSSLSISKEVTTTENNALWKTQGPENNSEDGCQSEVLNLLQDAPSVSVSSLNKSSSKSYAFKGFIPVVKGIREEITLEGSSMLDHANKDSRRNETTNTNHEETNTNHEDSQTKSAQNGATGVAGQPEKVYLPVVENQQDQSFAKHGPVSKGMSDKNIQMTVADQARTHANTKPSSMSELHTVSSIHQSLPPYSPLNQYPNNHDAYTPFVNMSTYSSLIVSTLLQNPSVYAAACLAAASFWPSASADVSFDSTSETLHGGFPARHANPSPSMAAIAGATVAAASAWWASQGLLPVFPPLHTGFAFVPASMTTASTTDTAQLPEDRNEVKGADVKVAEQSEALKARHFSSKSLVPSDSDESRQNDPHKSRPLTNDEFQGPNNVRSKKKLDRSSCGSNTSSGGEVETDLLEKQVKENDEAKQAHFDNLPSGETNTRRVRSSGSMNESWKEVSEEGRLAFQALFTREVLPQSFSPPSSKDPTVPVNLTFQACPSEPANTICVQGYADSIVEGSLTSENLCGKQKAQRTGFKPYKRCLVEAKESCSLTGEEGGNKRIRLEEETSI